MDRDSLSDIYVRDLIEPFQTKLISVNGSGNEKGNGESGSPSISADGARVAFVSSATNLNYLDKDIFSDVYVRILDGSPTTILASVNAAGDSKGDFYSGSPTISANGRRVAFLSESMNLDPRDRDPNIDVYVRILEPEPTTILASGPGVFHRDSQDATLSADGMRVAFATGNSLVSLDPFWNVDVDIYV